MNFHILYTMAHSNIKVVFTLLSISIAFLMTSCSTHNPSTGESKIRPYNYQKVGDSLSNVSQQILLSNVGRELNAGGSAKAIEFCHLNALRIMDSLSNSYNVKISRITTQPRNPSNMALDSELEILNWLMKSSSQDTVVKSGKNFAYYKGIKLGMPACLKCHGSKNDIDNETSKIIQARYPYDLATNYQLGDFRGAWKVEFEE